MGAESEDRVFSRFTPIARTVTQRARIIAVEHEQARVGTGCLLLALTEQSALAQIALSDLGVTYDTAYVAMEWPEIGLDRSSVPWSAQSKKVMEMALREALTRGHNYVGTEHLLLGIVARPGGQVMPSEAMKVLDALGVTPDQVVRTVERLLGGPGRPASAYKPNAEPVSVEDRLVDGAKRLYELFKETPEPKEQAPASNGKLDYARAQRLARDLLLELKAQELMRDAVEATDARGEGVTGQIDLGRAIDAAITKTLRESPDVEAQ